jgi:hypothetical protein
VYRRKEDEKEIQFPLQPDVQSGPFFVLTVYINGNPAVSIVE